jgi:2-keto-4-pentenoate hydratase/2-oxohepta-3-ene-1,7-dioic acid hydratase in catechol pathway
MKLASFSAAGERFWGLVRDDGLVALSPHHPDMPTLQAVVEAERLHDLQPDTDRPATHGLSEVRFEIPLASPEKLICVGVNYPDRNAEYKDGQDAPPNPSLFIRFPRSFVGHGEALRRPPESPQLDYEGEIALIVGKAGRRIPEAEAMGHVAAVTLANEGTIRDWVRHAKFNVTQGKNWDASGSIGPFLVPYRAGLLDDIRLVTRVNGEIRQDDRTSRMIFPPARLISYISTFTTLVPGDVILTGTPTGAGARRDPPVWLKPGDVVEVEADGIGLLSNPVADE